MNLSLLFVFRFHAYSATAAGSPFIKWNKTAKLIEKQRTDHEWAIWTLDEEASDKNGLLQIDTGAHFINKVYRTDQGSGDKPKQETKKKKAAPVKVKKITLSKTKAVIKLVKTKYLQLKVKKITPSNAAKKSVKWTSSNTRIATVNSKGRVKAKKPGKVTITATATDGSKKKAKCIITVKRR